MTNHVAYMTSEARDSLKEIIYEKHVQPSGAYYELFWYHWPEDGVFPWEDLNQLSLSTIKRGSYALLG